MKETTPSHPTFAVEVDEDEEIYFVCRVCDRYFEDDYEPDLYDRDEWPTLRDLFRMANEHIRTPRHRNIPKVDHNELVKEITGKPLKAATRQRERATETPTDTTPRPPRDKPRMDAVGQARQDAFDNGVGLLLIENIYDGLRYRVLNPATDVIFLDEVTSSDEAS